VGFAMAVFKKWLELFHNSFANRSRAALVLTLFGPSLGRIMLWGLIKFHFVSKGVILLLLHILNLNFLYYFAGTLFKFN
jgi:hypothetical protein